MDWTPFLNAAVDIARETGRMLKEGLRSEMTIFHKGEVDLVTNYDSAAQAAIIKGLFSRYPDHDFLAEEDVARRNNSDFCWIIDPIDGTTNFAHGLPIYCVSIALEYRGRIVLGLVIDPSRGEEFTAMEHKGAFLNGEHIRVSSVRELDQSLLATGFPYDLRESTENNLNHFNRFVKKAQGIRRCGSAALDLCYVACGRFDGFWELKLNPWDVAAAALILTEAGGNISDFGGNTFSIHMKETLGSNGAIHRQMMDVLGVGSGGEDVVSKERGK
jgi:myo-inositol-1(or 4)-monophosphatase